MSVRLTPLPVPDAVAQAWKALDASWDDEQAHRRFIALCVMEGALPIAGKLYREVRETDKARRAVAEQQIDAVMAAALSSLDLTRSPPSRAHRRLQWVAFGLSAFFVLYALWSILRARPP